MRAFPEDDAIQLGGWDRRYARVLAVGTHGEIAVALVDSNGDGSAIELDLYRWGHGEWEALSSSGVGSVGELWSNDMLISCGQARPHERVSIEHAGQQLGVTAQASGWWIVLSPAPGGAHCT